MKVEVLFPDLINLYGELGNAKLLKMIFKEDCFYTNYSDEPKFIKEDVDLIYIGPCSEARQLLVLKKFLNYKDRLKELIEKGCIFICVGNGGDYFGQYILDDDKNKIECLKFFSYHTEIDTTKRHNCFFLGKDIDGLEYVGFKSQFGLVYDVKDENLWLKTLRGSGNNKDQKDEGFRYKNFFLTNLIGPFLVMNPYFLKKVLQLKKYSFELDIFDDMIKAYSQRVEEFKDPKTEND